MLGDRHRQRRLHPQVLPLRPLPRGDARAARRHRRMGAHELRLDGPHRRLQGRLRRHPGRQPGVLRALRRQREDLVQAHPGKLPVPEPRHRQPADRPQQAERHGQGHLRPRHPRDRRGHLRQRRQGGGHQLRADPLQLHRPDRRPGNRRRSRLRPAVHHPDERQGGQADLPRVLREERHRHRLAVRLPAVLALRRERRDPDPGKRVHPVGRRADLQGQAEADAVGLRCRFRPSVPAAGLHPLRGQAGLPRRPARAGTGVHRCGRVPRRGRRPG
ncbi:hypothetical protein D3C78_1178260 [compost metagenome]